MAKKLTEEQLAGKWTPEELLHPDQTAAEKKAVPLDWGHPGCLTKDECDCFVKFRDEMEKRGGEFRSTVYCFGEEEGEAFAVCRWLRARKFVYDDVVKMIEEATEVRADARTKDFYPNPEEALGVDPSIFISLYPQLYFGNVKSGCPLFISKPGVLSVDGMECITSLQGILRFHWYVMMHDYASRLRANKEHNPEQTRFECVTVLDLEGLSMKQLGNRALGIIKEQTAIDSVCFPETMARMVIINAPRFFSATWTIIKGWIDPRTVSKIDVISSRKAWEKKLLEIVDADELPSDYGGKALDTKTALVKDAPGGMTRLVTELMFFRSHGSQVFALSSGEEVEVWVYTRATNGATFSITDADHKKTTAYVEGVKVVHKGEEDPEKGPATRIQLTTERIKGPANIKIKADSNSSRFAGSEKFLVVFQVY